MALTQGLKILVLSLLLVLMGFYFINYFEHKKPDLPNNLLVGYKASFQKYFIDNSPSLAYSNFKKDYQNQDFNSQHQAAHLFGNVLYQKSGLDGISVCDNSFGFGCYHGFFAAAVADKGIDVASTLDKKCQDLQDGQAVGCQHGIGHGLLEYFGTNQLSKALAVCQTLTKLNKLFGCASGVFMEYNVPVIVAPDHIYTQARQYDSSNPYSPCTGLPSDDQITCYNQLPQYWDAVLSADYNKISSLCDSISDIPNRDGCYQGIGSVAAPSSNYDSQKTLARCRLIGDPSGQVLCLVQAAWSFYYNPNSRPSSLHLCDKLDSESRKQCPTS